MRSALLKSLAILTLAWTSSNASAVTLDWDTVSWTPGSLTNSYDIDPSAAGNDVTLTVSGDTGQLGTEQVFPFPQTPALTTNLQGGLVTAKNSLTLMLDLANQTQNVVVTVNFSAQYSAGVTNVSFTIFDVDYANISGAGGAKFQDELSSIRALSIDGVTLIAPIITVSPNNTLSGTGLNQVVDGNTTTNDTGAGSGSANVTISFGANAIKSFTFVYGSGSDTPADPTAQHIGIGDITFTAVPEINPTWGAVASCLLAAVLILRHSAKFRK